jgi:hypothetical protein
MKCYIAIIIMLSSTAFALDVEIAAASKAIQGGDAALINQSLVNLNSAVRRFEPVDSPVNKPSPDRIEARRVIAAKLQPLKQPLIGLTSHSDQSVAGTATVILGHIPNDSEVGQVLLSNLEKTASADLASKSLSSLFQSGLADASARNVAAKRMSEFDMRDNSGQSVALALLQSGNYYSIPEGFETYLRLLKDDKRISAKLLAARAITSLGPAGAKALPELEKLLQELEQNGGDFRDVNTIKRAIMLVSGRSDTPQPAISAATQTTPVPAAATPLQQPKSTPTETPSPSTTVAESKSSSWPWIIGAILLLVVAGGIVLYLRRK